MNKAIACLPLIVLGLACAGELPVRPSVPQHSGLGPASATAVSCLTQPGPVVTLSGTQTTQYWDVRLADNTKIDATAAQWFTPQAENQPTNFGGGVNLCWSGGEVLGQFAPSTPWNTMHDKYGQVAQPNAGGADIENLRVFDYGDGISHDRGGPNWMVRGVYVKYSRDDCIENDFYNNGTVEDSFLDGCYSAFSMREYVALPNDSAHRLVVRNSLIRLQAYDAVYSGPVPNHNAFWKLHQNAPRIELYDNIFRADAASYEGPVPGSYMIPPSSGPLGNKLAACSNNTIVWLGDGDFPEPLPACFTLTTDKTVWDNAVATWNAAHPASLSDIAPPIVSMFQPGIVGDLILTGVDSLIATASDDRGITSVQFQLDGADIGPPQTSPIAYLPAGPDSPFTRDLTTKYMFSQNWAGVPTGQHTVQAVARDAAGHVTTSASVTVTVQ